MKFKLYIFLFLLSSAVFAQSKQVETSIDTTKNKIGAEFKLTLKTVVSSKSKVVFPKLKNIGPLEVIQSYPIDTVKKNDTYELIKKYGLTQFDSGRYTIPSIKILIDKKPFLTDPISVEVANVKVDTLQQKMYDIKDITTVESSIGDWWKYVLAVLLMVGIGVFVYWFIKKRQKKKIEEEVYKTPIEKATSLLNNLEKKELWQKGEVKEYYSELTDIARNYIEEAIQIPAMESTTSELIQGIRTASTKKKMTLTPETVENLERVLRQADLVKFAKSKPLDFEITEDRNKIQKVILTLDNAIPTEVPEEDELLNEAQRQKQIKLQLLKKRNKRIATAVGSVVFVLFAVTTFFIVTKGFKYVKDNILGHPTKELLEGEWVKSEYGNPGVLIETPKVLKRMDTEKALPKETMALIKEMQLFAYGSMIDNFYITVSTSKFKNPVELDLAKTLEGALKVIEAQGGQNIIVKQEDFQTNEGVQGLKGYGTMTILNPVDKTSAKAYYEILLFKQDQGLQQITILHEEGDTYANDITTRVLNSVELRKASN
ncbi:protein BatD [Flavobacterium poyangense]|uniref:protein BatD n=1 Tax=Flavobacterium poyangense TaxID=2204302 RepID=UPI00141DE9E0|nr:protein BatD [Flavobacterium sp. JXAS1]